MFTSEECNERSDILNKRLLKNKSNAVTSTALPNFQRLSYVYPFYVITVHSHRSRCNSHFQEPQRNHLFFLTIWSLRAIEKCLQAYIDPPTVIIQTNFVFFQGEQRCALVVQRWFEHIRMCSRSHNQYRLAVFIYLFLLKGSHIKFSKVNEPASIRHLS